MKIVQVISSLGKGGAERLVVDLCNQLAETPGAEVFLCVFYENENQPSFKNELKEKVRYINLSKKGKIDISFQIRLIRFLLKLKPNAVNSHLSGTILYLYLPILLLKKIKFFHTIHNLAEEETPGKFLQKVRRFIYRTHKLVPVSISTITQKSHSNLYRINSVLIYNGVKKQEATMHYPSVKQEIESYKKNEATKVFLSIGRINSPKDQKNYKLLLEVFKEALQHHINVILVIIGADNSADQLTLNQLLDIKPDTVFFVGAKHNIVDYMLNADVYCLSSKFEGLPITVIEALAYGLPVISTNVGGIPELITDNENGLLVDQMNANAYFTRLKDIIYWDKNKMETVKAANVNKYNTNFSIEIACRKYYEMYLKYENK
ncbi:MAG: glycosyltransferase [Bacteroidota bacterium]